MATDPAPRYAIVISFSERENAEKAREQIAWAMARADLIPFHMDIEGGDPMSDTDVDHILVYTDKAGEWRWSAKAANGEIVAEGESHRDRHDAVRAAQGVFGDTIEICDEDAGE